jgi:hypothetical protein
LVGSEFFRTGDAGYGGSFAGVAFASGFDRIVLDTTSVENGALLIDDFRFEGSPAPTPEPATVILFATGLVGACLRRRLRSPERDPTPSDFDMRWSRSSVINPCVRSSDLRDVSRLHGHASPACGRFVDRLLVI